MNNVAAPPWNSSGLLPPIDPELPASTYRSPYPMSLKDVVIRFSTSPERRAVLQDFLGYRGELHRMGIEDCIQWIDGSFLKNVETIEHRAPRDLDVVSFFNTTNDSNISEEVIKLFDQAVAKYRFSIDAYFVELNQDSPRELSVLSAYWLSMRAHRRTQAWKGFLQVELAPTEDPEALT